MSQQQSSNHHGIPQQPISMTWSKRGIQTESYKSYRHTCIMILLMNGLQEQCIAGRLRGHI